MTEDVGQPSTPRAARRRGPVLRTALGLALVLGGGTAMAVGLSGPEATPTPPTLADSATASRDVGESTALPAPVPSAAAETQAPEDGDSEDSAGSSTEETADDEAIPVEEPAPVEEPVSVNIPAIGVTSDLLHLGLDDEGALAVPEGDDFDTAAWYDGSPRPGEDGPAVILGHVSSIGRGPSVFFDLAALSVGDTVEVTRADGSEATFEVYDLQQFPKNAFPTAQVYGNTPGPELRVITCAGTISESTGHYNDNVIVFAREA
ncbi:putative secreted protein [Serinicoccus hydrothermalis]|uniref:Putative secreted protein n=1 Tax=Serinicoccus hydrothermalis TaxID=1758689 RepID=A0A1B1NCQ8_9MICO|nr:class F sortase [Serinicoccus hydrothermalis]ANS79155.1 putative secreted protein [Serinicoccus hydrothermalis]